MKSYILLMFLFVKVTAQAQSLPWEQATTWKLYDMVDINAVRISIDSLKKLTGRELPSHDLHFYLKGSQVIDRKNNPRWIGAYLMSYVDKNGVFRKFLISNYAGFVFDDGTKDHYDLEEPKWQDWRKYIEDAYDRFFLPPMEER